MSDRAPLSLIDQSLFIERLLQRCAMRDGETAGETVIVLTKEDAQDLDHLSMRLARMAPFQGQIEKLVMRK